MNIEEAKCNIGREIKFNNIEKLSKHWQETIQKSHKISIHEQTSTTEFRLIFKDQNNEIIDFWVIDFYEIDIELVDIVKGMTFEEAKLNTGKEVKFNNLEQLSEYWQRMIHKGYKVFIDDVINEKNIKVVFKDKDREIILFWVFELDKFDISLVHNVQGMTIEESKRYIGAEVELLEHTKPYMNNHSKSVANIESKNKPSKLIISDVIDGIVKVTSPEGHLYNLNPEHIALKVIKHLDIETVVLGDGESLTDKIKKLALDAGFKLKKQKDGTMDLNTYVYDFARKLINDPLEEQRKPVHEWNVDDAFYANNHGEEVEVFDFDEWVSLDEITVGQARILDKFRIKPKQVFLKAGTYLEEDLLKIISDNFKK